MDETVSQNSLANGQTTSGLYINEGDGDDDHPGGRSGVVDGLDLPSVSDFKSLPKSPLNWLGRGLLKYKSLLKPLTLANVPIISEKLSVV